LPIPKDISRSELFGLLNAYDIYIQNSNNEDRYKSGWYPVCINEFYDCEWSQRPDCYNANNDPYPLCKGKSSDECLYCCLYENMIEG
jgi:hypothetical protein